jgi:hypothetical protein
MPDRSQGGGQIPAAFAVALCFIHGGLLYLISNASSVLYIRR